MSAVHKAESDWSAAVSVYQQISKPCNLSAQKGPPFALQDQGLPTPVL